MKKIFILVAAVFAIAVFNATIALKTSSSFDIVLANIEALAQGENPFEDCYLSSTDYSQDGCRWYLWICPDGTWLSNPHHCIAK